MLSASTHALTVVVAASYLTLGFADTATASGYWWLYGVVMLILTVVNLVAEEQHRNGRD